MPTSSTRFEPRLRRTASSYASRAVLLALLAACHREEPAKTTPSSISGEAVNNEATAKLIAQVQGSADGRFAIASRGAELRAEDPINQLETTLGGRGLSMHTLGSSEPDWRLQLSFESYGCRGLPRPASAASPRASYNRVDYVRGDVTEWYVNGPMGVEQGFTLRSRPSCTDAGQVAFNIRVGGDVQPSLHGSGASAFVDLSDKQGRTVLRYSHLFAKDADGKALTATMTLAGQLITLQIEDKDARYPIEVDPLIGVPKQEIIAPDASAADQYGFAVAIDGDTAVVGAPFKDGTQSDQGKVYVYTRNALTGVWALTDTLLSPTPRKSGQFGFSVAVSGNRIIVGEPDPTAAGSTGKAYIFTRLSPTGLFSVNAAQALSPSDGAAKDQFGYSVAISGGVAAVGAPLKTTGGFTGAGQAYIFTANLAGVFSQSKILTAVSPAKDEHYGWSVAAFDDATAGSDLVFVGAPDADNVKGSKAGEVDVWIGESAAWIRQNTLLPQETDGTAGVYSFGYSVDFKAGRALVGAPGADPAGKSNAGAAYAFLRPAGTGMAAWTADGLMSRGIANDAMGQSVALSNTVDGALVGARFATSPAPESIANAGAAYVFDRNATTKWGFTDDFGVDPTISLGAAPAKAGDNFGWSVGVTGNIAIVGAPGRTVASSNQGAVYIYAVVKQQGDACTSNIQCQSGFCVDGFCCNTACGQISDGVNNDVDCQACSAAKSGGVNGTCKILAAATVCGGGAGGDPSKCSQGGTCNGTSAACNALPSPSTTKCAAGDDTKCIEGYYCDGVTSGTCPTTNPKPAANTVTCNASGDASKCVGSYKCDGVAVNMCPTTNSTAAAMGTQCGGPDNNNCVAKYVCDGTTKGTCPTAGATPASMGTVCRAAADLCDAAEACDGTTAMCPMDKASPAGTACGGAADASKCIAGGMCDGTLKTCPGGPAPAGTICDPVGDASKCVKEYKCDGTAKGSCPTTNPTPAASTVVCDAAGDTTFCASNFKCDGTTAGSCPKTNGTPASMGTVCRAASDLCDVDEVCNGTTAACPGDAVAASGTECRAQNGTCDQAESCNGVLKSCPVDIFAPPTTQCGAGNPATCNGGFFCLGTSNACSTTATPASATTVCNATGDPSTCAANFKCDGVSNNSCPRTNPTAATAGTTCRAAAGVCDQAEMCDGVTATCAPDAFAPVTKECRPDNGSGCDVADFCSGTSASCGPDLVLPAGTVCRGATDLCDAPELCNGATAACPLDRVSPLGLLCRPSAGVCDVGEFCDGSAKSCPTDIKQAAGTVCRGAVGFCDAAETCDGNNNACPTDSFQAAGTICRFPSGVCDLAETCDGASGQCPVNAVASNAAICRPATNECDAAELCDGSGFGCAADAQQPDGSACSKGTCQSGTCRPEADLRVSTTFNPMGANGQDPLSIDVSVTNVGKAPADNPLVKIAIPPGATVQSVSGDGWVCQTQGDSIVCLRPTLDAGGSAPIKVVLTPPLDKTSFDVTTSATSKTFEANPVDNTTTTTTPNKNPLNIAVSGGGVSSCAAAPGAGQPGQPLAMLGLLFGCAVLIQRRRVAAR